MAVTTTELRESRSETKGERATLKFVTIGTGAETETDVMASALFVSPATYNTLTRGNPDITPIRPGSLWMVEVPYIRSASAQAESTALDAGDVVIDFDTTGGTQHITQGYATVNKYAASETASDLKGAIGVTSDAVEGVDIDAPAFAFTITIKWGALAITPSYIDAIYRLTSKVNDDSYDLDVNGDSLTFEPGELKFKGARGRIVPGQECEITYNFEASPNATGLAVGDITGIDKAGWDYLWALYGPSIAGTGANAVLTMHPKAAYVEQVYERGDFSALGL